MKKRLRIIAAVLLAVAVALGGCSSEKSSSESATAEAPMVSDVAYAVPQSDEALPQNSFNGNNEEEIENGGIAAEFNTEEYSASEESSFLETQTSPLSTFSADVDTASYSNVRRFINEGMLPDTGAVRIEELINYFDYDYQAPEDGSPFSAKMQMGTCPWNKAHYLAMIGMQGKKVEKEKLPKSNLVFLLDVSGSMDDPDKLPLLKDSFKLLVNELTENDRVSIVVYAGASGAVLEGARGDEKRKILSALNKLNAGGSTAGAEGIELAYEMAEEYFIEGGNNRIILATDGDFNVGVSSESELENLIERKRDKGVFLSVLGFGTGNLKDNKMEILADKGNGNYAYIDSIKEAQKVLVSEMSGTLLTIAKDVKLQVEFNPRYVKAYRLIGYDNRRLNNEDFNDDSKDAGEIGAGHTVTALYEIVPADGETGEKLRYAASENKGNKNEVMFLKIRYKEPDESESKLMTFPLDKKVLGSTDKDFQFAAAVAEFGLLLQGSEYKENASYDAVIQAAQKAVGKDEEGYRRAFIELVKQAERISE